MQIAFLICFFVLFSFITVVYAQIPDYNKPYAPISFDKPIYTWTDKVRMTIVAPSWNADRYAINTIGSEESHAIKISTRGHLLGPYKFVETDLNSGVFVGEVTLSGFSHDADGDGKIDTTPRTFGSGPTNGFLESERDSAITLTFEFADGVTLTKSAPINWNIGEVFFLGSQYFPTDQVAIRVIDPDMNLNPEALDNVTVKVYSDSDFAGIDVSATELSEEAGVFEGKMSFSKTSPSSGNRLFAVPGDVIYAKYDDNTLPVPYSQSDDLEITAHARLESNVPPLKRIVVSDIRITDRVGSPIRELTTDNQVQVVGTIRNEQENNQDFVFLIQISDNQNIVSLSWVSGTLEQFQKLDVSQSWIPDYSGDYTIQTFIWDSLSSALPLSAPQETSVKVQ